MNKLLKCMLIGLGVTTLVGWSYTPISPYTGFSDFTFRPDYNHRAIIVHEKSEDSNDIYFDFPQDALKQGVINLNSLIPNITTKMNESVYIGNKQLLLNSDRNPVFDFTKPENLKLTIKSFNQNILETDIYNLHFESSPQSDILLKFNGLHNRNVSTPNIVSSNVAYNGYYGIISDAYTEGKDKLELFTSFTKDNPDIKINIGDVAQGNPINSTTPLYFVRNKSISSLYKMDESYTITSPNNLVTFTNAMMLISNGSSTAVTDFKIADVNNNIESYSIINFTGLDPIDKKPLRKIIIHTKPGVTSVSGQAIVYSLGDNNTLKLNDQPYNPQRVVTVSTTNDSILEVKNLSNDINSTVKYPIIIVPNE